MVHYNVIRMHYPFLTFINVLVELFKFEKSGWITPSLYSQGKKSIAPALQKCFTKVIRMYYPPLTFINIIVPHIDFKLHGVKHRQERVPQKLFQRSKELGTWVVRSPRHSKLPDVSADTI